MEMENQPVVTTTSETDVKQCPFCGETVKAVARKCRFCGELLDVGDQVPNKASSPVQVIVNNGPQVSPYAPPPPIVPKKRQVFVILGIVFGLLGVHNFYAGYTGRGGIQLATTLFLGWLLVPLAAVAIWVILELLFVTEDERSVRMV